MKLLSGSFLNNERLNIKYVMRAAGGENVSPEFFWEDVPGNTKSFVLTFVDHHPVASDWVHWIVINIPGNIKSLAEGASLKNMPSGSLELNSGYGTKGYGGPQPPKGTGVHKYEAVIYALNTENVDLKGKISEKDLLKNIKPYIIEQAGLTGLYER